MAGSKMLEKHIKALAKMEGKKVEAGWFESDRYGGSKSSSVGVPVAKIARIQEFGATIHTEKATIVIPARPFMRLAWSTFSSSKQNITATIARKLINGDVSPETALEQIGHALEGHIVRSIRNGGWQANAPSTVKRKGFDKPLIDTAHMWKSVNHKVS